MYRNTLSSYFPILSVLHSRKGKSNDLFMRLVLTSHCYIFTGEAAEGEVRMGPELNGMGLGSITEHDRRAFFLLMHAKLAREAEPARFEVIASRLNIRWHWRLAKLLHLKCCCFLSLNKLKDIDQQWLRYINNRWTLFSIVLRIFPAPFCLIVYILLFF